MFHYPWDVVRVRMASDMTKFNEDRIYKVNKYIILLGYI